MAEAQPEYPEASLLGIPLEIRHMIFKLASTRDSKPKKVLRYWFEKKETKEKVVEYWANNPDGAAPRVVYDDREYEPDTDSEVDPAQQDEIDEDDEEEQDENQDEDDEEEEEQDGDQGEDEDEQADENEDEDEAQDVGHEDEEVQDQMVAHADADQEMSNGNDEVDAELAPMDERQDVTDAAKSTATAIADPNSENVQARPTTVSDQSGPSVLPGSGNENKQEDGDHEMVDHEDASDEEPDEDQVPGDDEDRDEDMANENENDNTTTSAAQTNPPPSPGPIIRPHNKWRHIPKFVRLTQCPPPSSLFLINKQLSLEAKSWFYNVAVLKIDATASFSHFTFFEVALSAIADAAFSPMENIRKADVTFVWDTTWIRSEQTGYAASVFSFFLQSRAEYVLNILQRAPDLEAVVVHWHDSAEDEEAQALMQDILEKFVCGLSATIDTKTHIIAADAKPHARSIAGKRRIEFQGIVDNPPEAF